MAKTKAGDAPVVPAPPRRSGRRSTVQSTAVSDSRAEVNQRASEQAASVKARSAEVLAAESDEGPSKPKKAKVDEETTVRGGGEKAGGGQTSLKVGDVVPDGIKLRNETDDEVDVKQLLSQKGAVFFVYPKAATPGCTNQACGFRDLYAEISDAGFQVFGLSMDGPKAQKNWQAKQNLQYHLLCDPKQHLIKLLGASKSTTQVQRSHYVVAKGGELLKIQSPASPKDGPSQALEFVKSLA